MPIDTSGLPYAKPARKVKSSIRKMIGQPSLEEKCISLSARIVTHNTVCMRCENPKRKALESHHLIKRRYKKTVALTFAQIPLCKYDCHPWAEANPEAAQAWIDETFPGRRQMLEAINRGKGKPDWDQIYADLVRESRAKGVPV
jgi:hypothetical protein